VVSGDLSGAAPALKYVRRRGGDGVSTSGHTVIEAASDSLLTLLRKGLAEITTDDVTVELLSPSDLATATVHLTVFLYRIERNGDVSNRDRTVNAEGGVSRPPLALDLSYLLTAPPTSNSPTSTDTLEQHRILGRAVQVLQEYPVLRGIQSGEDARVTMHAQSMDETLNLWNTFSETAYQPSVSYLVSPVFVESMRRESTVPVAEWHTREYVPSAPRQRELPTGGPGGE
jgi:hypothetical protein